MADRNYYLTYLYKMQNTSGMSDEEFKRVMAKAFDRRKTLALTEEEANCEQNRLKNAVFTREIEKWYRMWEFGLYTEGFFDYRKVRIPKHSGGYRTLEIPNDTLKKAQTKLLNIFNRANILPAQPAHGFTKFRGTLTALETHQRHGARWFLKADISNFFPSCTLDMVMWALKHNVKTMFVSDEILLFIAGVCTDAKGKLPQGSPMSPMLSNLIMVPYDLAIKHFVEQYNMTYTRYADDILISWDKTFGWAGMIKELRKLLKPFIINTKKTRYGNFNGRNWNLGLMYNNKMEITVGHKQKRAMKCRVHNWLTKPELRTNEEWHSLLGLLNYYEHVQPGSFTEAIAAVKESRADVQIEETD